MLCETTLFNIITSLVYSSKITILLVPVATRVPDLIGHAKEVMSDVAFYRKQCLATFCEPNMYGQPVWGGPVA